MAIRTLYLLRHGQYDLAASPADGLGGGLTALGRRQARRAATHFARLPIQSMHLSTLRRAVETAQIVAAALPPMPVHAARMLWECVPALDDASRALFKDLSTAELEHDAEQAERAFERYVRPSRADRHELIVAHGNLIRYFVARAMGAPGSLWINMDIHECGISIVQIADDGRMQVLAHNDTGICRPRCGRSDKGAAR